MSNKRKSAFIFSQDFDNASKAGEEERQERMANPASSSLAKPLEERVASIRPEKPAKTTKVGERQRKRFQNTLEGRIPNLYIKKEEYSSVHVYERIMEEFRILSVKRYMSVGDLINLAAYEYLKKEGVIKD